MNELSLRAHRRAAKKEARYFRNMRKRMWKREKKQLFKEMRKARADAKAAERAWKREKNICPCCGAPTDAYWCDFCGHIVARGGDPYDIMTW